MQTPGGANNNAANSKTPGPAPPSGGAFAAGAAGGPSKKLVPIQALNPYQSGWTIRAKCASKGQLRTAGAAGTQVLSAELVDAHGTAIEATFWRDAATQADATLDVGSVYLFSKGRVKPANKAYSNVRNDYCLDFGQGALFELAPDQGDAAGMSSKLSYVSIDRLHSHVGKKAPVDVLGLAVDVASLGSVKRKSDDSELSRRDVTLLDASGMTVTLTLWGKHAEEEGAALEQAAKNVGGGGGGGGGAEHESNSNAAAPCCPPVLSVSHCRVGDYNGVSLSALGRSVVAVEPSDSPQADALRLWWDEEGRSVAPVSAGEAALAATGKTPGGTGSGPRPRADLASLLPVAGQPLPPPEAKPEYATVVATLAAVDPEQTMWYAAAPPSTSSSSSGAGEAAAGDRGGRKVVERDGGWWCEYSQRLYPSMVRRFVLQAKAGDSTGEASLSFFDDAARVVLGGKTADELAALKDNDPKAFAAALADAAWRPWVLRVASRTQEYNGERRRRLTVHSATPLDFAGEARRALAALGGAGATGVAALKAEVVA